MKINQVPFQSAITDVTAKYTKIPNSEFLVEGEFPIIDQGANFVAGFTNMKSKVTYLDYPVIIFGDHTRIIKYIDFPFAIGADGVKVLSTNLEIAYPYYIYYFLKFQKISSAGYSRHFKFLKEKKISLPELIDDQKRIAKVLSTCEQLIDMRKKSIHLLEELVKSTFLEMFGDPAFNKKQFKIVTVRDLIYEASYGTSKSSQGGKIPYIRMNNIDYNGYWDFSSLKYIDLPDKEKEKCLLKKGDVVFNRTNSKELVGKTGIYNLDDEMVIAGYLIRLRTNSDVNPYFLWGHLNSQYTKQRLFNLCRNIVGMANINAQEVQNIAVLKPPLMLQEKFAKIVISIEIIKQEFKESLKELENLYGSLGQKAFKGKLDLRKVEIPKEKEEVFKNLELERIAGKKIDGNLQVTEYKLNLSKIIKNEFGNDLFSVSNFEEAICKKVPSVDSLQVRHFLKKALIDQIIEQVYSGNTQQVMFKFKK